MTLFDDNTILALHRKYAPSNAAFEIIFTHCQIINKIANQLVIANKLEIDNQLIRTAALLHDIGYYPLLNRNGHIEKGVGIKHGVTGAAILRKEGADEAICRIAEKHTGVGLTKESIIVQKLPLPHRDLMPETSEEWLITYADKLHTKAIAADEPQDKLGWFVSPKTYIEHARTFGENNAEQFVQLMERYGEPNLQAMAEAYNQELK